MAARSISRPRIGEAFISTNGRREGVRQLTNGPEVLTNPTIGKGAIAAIRRPSVRPATSY